jgi:hypothetical protein
MKLNFLFLIIILLLLKTESHSQDFIDASVTAGIGMMSSDSPFISGFTSSVSVGAGKSYNVVTPRLSFYYAGDFNSLLPASDRDYYSYIRALAIKGIYAVNVSGDLYYEQGLGILFVNDRIFRNTDEWGTGFYYYSISRSRFKRGFLFRFSDWCRWGIWTYSI